MIKIIFTQPAYRYENVGAQEYNIETVMELNSDINSTEAILAFVRMLEIATYRITSDTIRRAADDYEMENEEFVDFHKKI